MFFIVLEGNEGSGKSTLAKKIVDYYNKKNISICSTREPGGYKNKFGEKIRSLIMEKHYEPTTELLLYMLSRASHIDVIKQKFMNSDIIICDRFYYSSAVYQGYVYKKFNNSGLTMEQILKMNEVIFSEWKPEITFVLLAEPKDALKRINPNKREVNRFDKESLQFHKYVYEGYQGLINKYGRNRNLVYIDANKSKTEVFNNVINSINKILEKHESKKS